jgi:HPt (histidine-containing phosphotransfer) domain-containing protein
MITAIREAVAAGDAPALRMAAHRLKGSIRYLGETQPFEQAFRLERMGAEDNLDGAEDALASLEQGMEQLIPSLEEYLRGGPPEKS